MTTCQVLRCQNLSTTTHTVSDEPRMEAAVCSSHKDMMEAGESWSLAAPGVVQMGMDIPPKLVSLRASDEPGREQGFTLTMDLDAAGQPRTQSVWVSDAKAKDLLDLLKFVLGEK